MHVSKQILLRLIMRNIEWAINTVSPSLQPVENIEWDIFADGLCIAIIPVKYSLSLLVYTFV